ncbi:mediator of RNA polymeras-like protein II transcription subunit 5 [Polyplosphaeria fusca]|uniref:Mediator of RNA polymerase II transcription subunit 5 n=1 Tax=Polyplosphaeria fusca TaxID=682080 RepID=A0A9P4V5B8_9PLEO|nr:mediator of RNA polymeras-like protein II transcription subunit 5 [Polyplosphaeria fusca]
MDSLIKEWSLFLDRCLENRIRTELFDATSAQLYGRLPIPGRKLAALLLKPRSANASSPDPRVVVYLERLLALRRVDAPDVLAAAFQFSRDQPPRPGDEGIPSKDDPSRWHNPPELEEIIFHRLHKAFANGDRPTSNAESTRTLIVVSKWMSTMVASHTSESMLIHAIPGLQQQPQQQSINVREALGMLVAAFVENVKTIQFLNHDKAKDLRRVFAQSLSTFIPFLAQTSITIANRLEISQKEHDLHDRPLAQVSNDAAENAGLEVAALQLEAVMDLAVLNTRAGLYVFINSLLVARPLMDDFLVINYLLSRYKVYGDNMCWIENQNIATDLITAGFDVLANGMYRSEPNQTMFCLKSFLVNKMPLLLTQLTASIFPMTMEMCITQALTRVDANAFPAFSQSFDDMLGTNNSLSDVRQDFLNACALHGLLPASAIERLLGETPVQGPPETKYNRKDLLNQCKENFEKVNLFIDEIDNLDGNAAAIVGALADFITHLCETQMTMYLKTLCNLLSRKPQALDVMLQFASPASILRPLCQFLDEWRIDADQGEYQPLYDEFGAILVLVLAFNYRYGLTYADLGIGPDSFVAQLLERGQRSIAPDDLTEEQGKQLESWLRGLYDADKEGLSNDVFASCRPQDFYLIVPTLFSQTVLACSSDVLSIDSVKGGLEYLQETFLLPSLVGGLTWMTCHALKQTHQDTTAVMQIFDKLIRCAPSSGDAQAMHSTIVSIVSSRLEKCFLTLKKRHPSRTDIDPLLQVIKGNLNYERSIYSSMTEFEKWTSSPNHTLSTSLRHSVQQLSQWPSPASLQLNPPNYTHKQLYASLKILGAYKTIRAIVEEIKTQTEGGNGAAALDIGVAMICSPMVENSALDMNWVTSLTPASASARTRMNLREMLKNEFENAASLWTADPAAAETIVRLHRRVEAQLADVAQAVLPATQIDIQNVSDADISAAQNISEEDLKAMNDVAAATIAAAGDLQASNQELHRGLEGHLDLSAAGAGLDLNMGGMGVGGMNTEGITADMTLPDLDLGDMGDMGDIGMGMGDDDDGWGLDFDNM